MSLILKLIIPPKLFNLTRYYLVNRWTIILIISEPQLNVSLISAYLSVSIALSRLENPKTIGNFYDISFTVFLKVVPSGAKYSQSVAR